jgi:ectoine hydroxylase-related dioxygenase (phytanoyl-CoA dioxygenase family)
VLTKEQIKQYQDDGFVIPDFKMSENDLLEIEKKHNQLIEKFPEYKNYCPAVLLKDESFLKYCLNEKIINFVEQLLGKQFALWNSSFFAKPAHNGFETPWHQDGQYWPINPLATCTVWLAIDDATEENGCLRFIKGSHKNKKLKEHSRNENKNLTLHQEVNKNEYDISKSVNLLLKRGQISLHDVYIVHGSKENKSSNSRRAMTMRFMPLTSKFDYKFIFDSITPFKINKIYKVKN